MYYYLHPQCNLKMALSVDKNHQDGGLIIMTFTPNDPAQMWETPFYVDGGLAGLVLINKLSGKAVCAPKDHADVTQVDIRNLNNRSVWHLAANNHAIRPAGDDSMHLNVAGNPPYGEHRNVCVWDWAHGASNNLWDFQRASN